MTKQEYLAMSLPYGVHAKTAYLGTYKYSSLAYSNEFGAEKDNPARECCLPILYPLSDLTKEIEHKGEKFVPIDELNNIIDDVGIGFNDHYIDYENPDNTGQIDWLNEPFIVVMWLIEHHFDIYGLIDKGEAIDVNSLDINPYK